MGLHITPLLFEEEHLVRQVEMSEEIWFVGADVCRVLGIRDHKQALERLDGDERGRYTVPTPGGDQEMTVVSEPGVYRLVFTSRKPVAERFKRWLAHEVIPSIRKTGAYAAPLKGEDPSPQDAQENEGLRLRHVTECRHTFGHQAAAQMWLHLGLPVVPAMLHDPRQFTLFDYQSVKSVGDAA